MPESRVLDFGEVAPGESASLAASFRATEEGSLSIRPVRYDESRYLVTVEPGASFGSLQAIEGVNEGEIAEGTKIIVDGVHFLRDGDRINAFDEVEPTS